MKKWLIPVGIIIAVVVIVGFWVVGIKNTALKHNQAVGKEWGNVETAYQRRNEDSFAKRRPRRHGINVDGSDES